MQILTLDKDKFVAVDGDVATVYSREKLEEEKKVAEYNIEQLEIMIPEIKAKQAKTTTLKGNELEAVKDYNSRLGIEQKEYELSEWQSKLAEVISILENQHGNIRS